MSAVRLLAAFLACLSVFVGAAGPVAAGPPSADVVILISLDGFRPDYLNRGVTPNLSALAAAGALGAMLPSFPSKTFPNHYAMVTGLRPDRNEVVDNTMVDPAIPGVVFSMSDAQAVRDRRWWDEATPLWVSAERQGIRTGTMYWPGSEAAIGGVRPSLWKPFDKSLPGEARVDAVLGWLDLPPDQRPRFVTLYFDEVDTAGHDVGPGPAIDATLAHLDSVIGRLATGLAARRIVADLIVVADHGMAQLSQERRIFADDLLPAEAYRSPTMGPYWSLFPQPGHEAQVEQALLRHPLAHLACWRKDSLPARFHYGRNPRVPPVFCLAEVGWEITTHAKEAGRAKPPPRGDHGFDPAAPEMRAVFVAEGPDIRPGVRLPAFDNVDVYPFVARLIGVRPEPGDGDLAPLRPALAR